MGFGIGTNTEHPEHGSIKGSCEEVAVKCWFTASGKSMPLMMKVQTKEEEIISVNDIHVLKSEKQWYAGILNVRYDCEALVQNRMTKFILLFCPEECSWKLVMD